MANDFLINKWRQWFKLMDINHRGEISRADVKDEGETFTKLSNLDAQQKKSVQDKLNRLSNDIVFRGKSGAINEDEFVEMNKQHYAADKSKFQEDMRTTFAGIFETIDLDQEGVVTEEAFVNIMRASGHENVTLNKMFFALYEPVNGKVPVKVLVDSWVQFSSCDDCSKIDIVLEGIKTGV